MEKEILKLLKEVLPEIDFETSDRLIDDGTLDSVSIATVIAELSLKYNVYISYDMINPQNFNSIYSMARLVEKLKEDNHNK